MRDFDQERQERHEEREKTLGDRQFKLGGEIFTYRAHVPVDVLRTLTSERELSGGPYIDAIVASCLDLVEPEGDAHKRFKKVLERKNDPNPITMVDLQLTFNGLIQESFRSPTPESSPSTDGDSQTGTGSTETSSTEPAEASAA